MQAALMLRSKSRERRKQRLKRGIKHELPSNVATKSIAPFPRYPPASWCAAGRAAWQEAAARAVGAGAGGAGGAARRCSVLGDHPTARRDPRGNWLRNNRVRDASYGSSSESDGEAEGALGEPWGVASLLYAGLGILALGLVVYFVGTGDKGFKTPALRLVGPSLIFAGFGCCLLRIAFCVFAKPCCKRRTIYKETRRLSSYGYGEARARAGGARPGPAQCSPARRLAASSSDASSLSSGEEDERQRRYRVAAGPRPTSPHTTVHQGSVHQSASQAVLPSASQSVAQTPLTPQSSSLQIPNIPSPSANHPTNVLHTNIICATPSTSAISSASAMPSASALPSTFAIPITKPSTSATRSASALPNTIVIPSAKPSTSATPSTSAMRTASVASSTSAIPTTSSKPSLSAIRTTRAASSTSAIPSLSAIPNTSEIRTASEVSSISPIPGTSAISSTSTNVPSSLHHFGHRRPPPRNVSFANGPDDELVLSPAQLRS